MIICDDCSSDSTWAILERFASSAPFPVFLHKNSGNLGSTQNFSQAISMCHGEIIALCDQDDVWMPEKLMKVEAQFADQRVGLVFSNAVIVDDKLNPLGFQLWNTSLASKMHRQIQQGNEFRMQMKLNVVTGATMAFRSNFWTISLPIPENIPSAHDGWIALVIASVSQFILLPEPLIYYRQHNRQQTGVPKKQALLALPQQHLREHLYQLEVLLAHLESISQIMSSSHPCIKPAQQIEGHISYIHAQVRHIRIRLGLSRCWLSRMPTVLTELMTGHYHRYSNGFRSAARDMIIFQSE